MVRERGRGGGECRVGIKKGKGGFIFSGLGREDYFDIPY